MKKRIEKIHQRIISACRRSGRDPSEVKLIAVSKNFPAETIRQAYQLGLHVFGENRAQEFKEKNKCLPADIEWHFIGHLQTNKIKYVLPEAVLIHSVDSLHLAKALSEFGQKRRLQIPVLLEINTSAEASKFGLEPQEALPVYGQMLELPALKPQGLMTIAPFTDNEKQVRKAFALLRTIREKLQTRFPKAQVRELSMGMSADFEWAIEEGSTMVRIGSAIFGARGR